MRRTTVFENVISILERQKDPIQAFKKRHGKKSKKEFRQWLNK